MENEEQSQEELRMENETMKLKLTLEDGKQLHENSESNLPPGIEKEFLDYIKHFEQKYEDVKRTTIYEFVGQSAYKKVEDIADSELDIEIEKVLQYLKEQTVGVGTIYAVDERAFYRFLTEDLMQEEIDDFRIKGMMHNFIYEDFYPNDEGDLRKYSEEFIVGLLAKKDERSFDFMFLMDEITLKQRVYKKKEAVNYLNAFRDAYEEICLKYFEITYVEIEGEIGKVNFDVNYEVKNAQERFDFNGKGVLTFIFEYTCWCIGALALPGVTDGLE
jgi:hypothetical protein